MTEPAAEAAPGPATDSITATAAAPEATEAGGGTVSQVYARGPGDLVDLAPYLLGFHPTDSVVLVAFPARGWDVCLTARADLTEVRRDGFVDYLAALVAQAGGRRLVVVVYGAAPPPPPSASAGEGRPRELPDRDVVDLVAEAGRLVDVELVGAYHVSVGRWWSYHTCDDAGCCPASGTPLLGDRSPAVAAAVFAGMTALPDRAALAAAIEPVDSEQRRELSEAIVAAERDMVATTVAGAGIGPWRTGALMLLGSVLSRTLEAEVPWLTPTVAARLVVGLTDTVVRDVAWAWTNDIHQCGPAGELWRQLARRTDEPYNAPPLFLTAWAAWRAGLGAVAVVTLERALAADPGYSAALMLEQLIAQGYDPANAGSLIPACPLSAPPPRTRRRRRKRRGSTGHGATAEPG
jgi:hypothetical protein